MATNKYVTYPETVEHMGVQTTLATMVLWFVDAEETFIGTPQGWRVGERLLELFPAEEKHPVDTKIDDVDVSGKIIKERTGEVVKVHPDDHAFLAVVLAKKPNCGWPKLIGQNQQTGEPLTIELGRRCLPLVDAWQKATDEDPRPANDAPPEGGGEKQLSEQN